jgi:regulator of replication initiation timing
VASAFRRKIDIEGAFVVAKVALRDVDLEPIDRLEEKVKMLVAMIDRLRADHARAADDNTRLGRELDAMRARLAEAEGAGSEVLTLREERDLIRSRVGDMLAQIESLKL